jgi:glycosyltransferase involved in cell wall biosynthesis
MRVGVVVFDDVDYGLDLAAALHEAGVSVVLYLSYQHAARYMGTSERPVERIHELGLLSRDCRVRLFRMPRIRDPRSALVVNRLARTMDRDGIDVAHLLVGPGEFWVAALAVRLRKIAVAATMIIPKPNVGEAVPASVIVGIYKLLARGADVIIVNGADQVGLVREAYGLPAARIAYVPLGPRTTALKWAASNSPEEPGAVLFFGAARYHKGLQILVEAQPLITARVAHARIMIASRGEEVTRCRDLMRDGSKFEVYDGFVPGDMAAAFFQRAALVALPYLSASTSGILMTAYAFGKPVVATRVGCLPEYVEEGRTGLLVPPGDVARFADAVVTLLSDDRSRREMGRHALCWAEEKRGSAARETVRAYERAIALHRGGPHGTNCGMEVEK